MARTLRRQPSVSRLRRPAAVGPAQVFAPVSVRLADQRALQLGLRRRPLSRLRPPQSVGAAVVFGPVRERLAGSHRPAPTRSALRLPTVIGPAAPSFVASPLAVRLAKPPVASRSTVYVLQQPTVVGAAVVFRPLVLTLVRQPRRAQHAVYRLGPPQTVSAAVAAVLARPVAVTLARRSRASQRASYRLQPPTVVSPLQQAVVLAAVAVKTVVRSVRYRPVQHRLSPPAAVRAATVFAPVSVRLTRRIRQAGGARSLLRAPTVIGAAVAQTIYTRFFGPPAPDDAGLGGTADTAGLDGTVDDAGLGGELDNHGFGPPGPRRG